MRYINLRLTYLLTYRLRDAIVSHDDYDDGRNVGRRMVAARSNCSRIGIEWQSKRRRIADVTAALANVFEKQQQTRSLYRNMDRGYTDRFRRKIEEAA